MEDRLNRIFFDLFQINKEDIGPGTTMENVGSWDSLSHIGLICAIEEEFSVELSFGEIVQMTSYSGTMSILQARATN